MTSEIGTIPVLGEEKDASESQVQEAARLEMIRAYEKVGPSVDSLTSSELKRVLKFVIGYSEVHHLITSEEPNLSESETKLIDDLFAFKSTLMGFYAVLKENNQEVINE